MNNDYSEYVAIAYTISAAIMCAIAAIYILRNHKMQKILKLYSSKENNKRETTNAS